MTFYAETRNRRTGTTIVTGHGLDWRIDLSVDGDGPWFTTCDEHGALVSHPTLALARSWAAVPDEWCDDCRDIIEARKETMTPLDPLCDNCGERHHDARTDPDDCDPGCDWDVLAGNVTRCPECADLNPNCDSEWHEPRHPADNPRHLTSDRIGFSVPS